jgi:hypothetical protein
LRERVGVPQPDELLRISHSEFALQEIEGGRLVGCGFLARRRRPIPFPPWPSRRSGLTGRARSARSSRPDRPTRTRGSSSPTRSAIRSTHRPSRPPSGDWSPPPGSPGLRCTARDTRLPRSRSSRRRRALRLRAPRALLAVDHAVRLPARADGAPRGCGTGGERRDRRLSGRTVGVHNGPGSALRLSGPRAFPLVDRVGGGI